jgi:hypothetical protein
VWEQAVPDLGAFGDKSLVWVLPDRDGELHKEKKESRFS